MTNLNLTASHYPTEILETKGPSLNIPEFNNRDPYDTIERDRQCNVRIDALLSIARQDLAIEGSRPSAISNLLEVVHYVDSYAAFAGPQNCTKRYADGLTALALLKSASGVAADEKYDRLAKSWSFELEHLTNQPIDQGARKTIYDSSMLEILPDHSLPKKIGIRIERPWPGSEHDGNERHLAYETEYVEGDQQYEDRKLASVRPFRRALSLTESTRALEAAQNGEITVEVDPFISSSQRAEHLMRYAHTIKDESIRREFLQQACGFIVHALEKPFNPDSKGFDVQDGMNRYIAGRIMYDLAVIPDGFSTNQQFNERISLEARKKAVEWLTDARHILINAVHDPIYNEAVGDISKVSVAKAARKELDRAQAYDEAVWFLNEFKHGNEEFYDVAAQIEELRPRVAEYIRLALGGQAASMSEKDIEFISSDEQVDATLVQPKLQRAA